MVFSEQLWLFQGQVEDSTVGDFFHPLNGTELGSPDNVSIKSITERYDGRCLSKLVNVVSTVPLGSILDTDIVPPVHLRAFFHS